MQPRRAPENAALQAQPQLLAIAVAHGDPHRPVRQAQPQSIGSLMPAVLSSAIRSLGRWHAVTATITR